MLPLRLSWLPWRGAPSRLPRTFGTSLAWSTLALMACAGAERSTPSSPEEVRLEPLDTLVQAETPACTASCPAGARIATFATTEKALAQDTFGGAFLYVKEGCETYCEPLTRCVPPNVPVVKDDTFACQLLPGFTRLEAPDTVDLSFGQLWDPSKVTP
jgi:hypothetical protein